MKKQKNLTPERHIIYKDRKNKKFKFLTQFFLTFFEKYVTLCAVILDRFGLSHLILQYGFVIPIDDVGIIEPSRCAKFLYGWSIIS